MRDRFLPLLALWLVTIFAVLTSMGSFILWSRVDVPAVLFAAALVLVAVLASFFVFFEEKEKRKNNKRNLYDR